MKQPVFTGSCTALITPFAADHAVDYPALAGLLDFQLENGTDALVVCGTTGEAAAMSYEERLRTIEAVVRHVDGRIPVIAGSGSNNTESAIALSRDAVLAGADALLVVDECFLELLDRPEDFAMKGFLGRYPNLLILKAFTKLYAMAGLREVADELETLTAKKYWPFPSYGEMLFSIQ